MELGMNTVSLYQKGVEFACSWLVEYGMGL